LRRHGHKNKVEIRNSRARGHATEIARELAHETPCRLLAVGGDGTLREVVTGALGTEAEVACIPLGTSNDWVKTHNIPLDPAEALNIALNEPAVPMDVGETNAGDCFINVAGIGFDALVVDRLNHYTKGRRLGPKAAYGLAVAQVFRTFRGADLRLSMEDQEVDLPRALLVAVGMCRYYGAGMRILPKADPSDGMFEIAHGSQIGPLELALLFRRIYRGAHVGHPKVGFARSSWLKVEGPGEVPYHLDGDLCGHLPVSFRIRPGAVRMVSRFATPQPER
jgi:YegS/Rv2252/BmrU family lipid kinase